MNLFVGIQINRMNKAKRWIVDGIEAIAVVTEVGDLEQWRMNQKGVVTDGVT